MGETIIITILEENDSWLKLVSIEDFVKEKSLEVLRDLSQKEFSKRAEKRIGYRREKWRAREDHVIADAIPHSLKFIELSLKGELIKRGMIRPESVLMEGITVRKGVLKWKGLEEGEGVSLEQMTVQSLRMRKDIFVSKGESKEVLIERVKGFFETNMTIFFISKYLTDEFGMPLKALKIEHFKDDEFKLILSPRGEVVSEYRGKEGVFHLLRNKFGNLVIMRDYEPFWDMTHPLKEQFDEYMQSEKYGDGVEAVLNPDLYLRTVTIANLLFSKAGYVTPMIFGRREKRRIIEKEGDLTPEERERVLGSIKEVLEEIKKKERAQTDEMISPSEMELRVEFIVHYGLKKQGFYIEKKHLKDVAKVFLKEIADEIKEKNKLSFSHMKKYYV